MYIINLDTLLVKNPTGSFPLDTFSDQLNEMVSGMRQVALGQNAEATDFRRAPCRGIRNIIKIRPRSKVRLEQVLHGREDREQYFCFHPFKRQLMTEKQSQFMIIPLDRTKFVEARFILVSISIIRSASTCNMVFGVTKIEFKAWNGNLWPWLYIRSKDVHTIQGSVSVLISQSRTRELL